MKILVLAGGTSPERLVSLASGDSIAEGLVEAGHEVVKLDTSRPEQLFQPEEPLFEGEVGDEPPELTDTVSTDANYLIRMLQAIEDAHPELVFLALHGGWGDNGGIQNLLQMAGIPYTGSGPVSSGVAMEKDQVKEMAELIGIPTPNWVDVSAGDSFFFESLVFPLIVKPNGMGSTYGLTKVEDQEELNRSVAFLQKELKTDVLIEGYIPGRELTCAILDGEALPLVEIKPKSGMYDYASKYTRGMTEYLVPAPVSDEIARDVQEYSRKICRQLRVDVAARVDFRLDEEGNPWFLEVNTLPGMTGTSLFPMAAVAREIPFPKLLDRIAVLSLRRFS